MKEEDPMPIICIKSEDSGITYGPLFKKNEQGEWELADKSFRKMFERHAVLERKDRKSNVEASGDQT